MSAAVSVLSLQKTEESAMLIIEGSVASSFSSRRAKALRSGSGSLEDGGLGSSPDSDGDGGSTLQMYQEHYQVSQMLAIAVIKLAFQGSFTSPFNKIQFHEQFEVLVHIVDT